MGDKGVSIGLSNLYYAILDDDPDSGVATYQAPVRIVGAVSANVNPSASSETLFADDGPYEASSTLGQIALELNVADLTLREQAALLGHTMAGGVMVRKATDIPPWAAVGFKSLKSNGKYRYTWLAKGKFMAPEQVSKTKGDSVEFNTPTITGNFVKRNCDDEWERHIDEDDADYLASMGTNWFNGPYGGAADVTAPNISSTLPANNAVGVAVGATFAWTFSEAIAMSSVTLANFGIFKDSDGAAVAGALTVNAARTVVTFTPSGALTAATAYRAIATVGVKDIVGNPLAANSVIKFTTA